MYLTKQGNRLLATNVSAGQAGGDREAERFAMYTYKRVPDLRRAVDVGVRVQLCVCV